MRNQNQKEDDSEGTQHAKELQATGDIMQRAETRKKFLHIVIKSTPNQFVTLRYYHTNDVTSSASVKTLIMVILGY